MPKKGRMPYSNVESGSAGDKAGGGHGGAAGASRSMHPGGVDQHAAPFKGGRSTGRMKAGGRKTRSRPLGGASTRKNAGHGY